MADPQALDVDAIARKYGGVLATPPDPDAIARKYGGAARDAEGRRIPINLNDQGATDLSSVRVTEPAPTEPFVGPTRPPREGRIASAKTGGVASEAPVEQQVLGGPIEGIPQAIAGVRALAQQPARLVPTIPNVLALRQPGSVESLKADTLNGASDVLEGAGKTAQPLAMGAAFFALPETLLTFGLSYLSGKAADQAAQFAQASPEMRRFLSNVAQTAVALGGSRAVLAKAAEAGKAVTTGVAAAARPAIVAAKLAGTELSTTRPVAGASSVAEAAAPLVRPAPSGVPTAVEQGGFPVVEPPAPVGETLGELVTTAAAPEPPALRTEAVTKLRTLEAAKPKDSRRVPFPQAPAQFASNLARSKDDQTPPTVVDVPLDKIVATQPTVSEGKVAKVLEQPPLTRESGADKLPQGLAHGDHVYLEDGMHRVMAAWARGDATVPMVVSLVNGDRLAELETPTPKVPGLVRSETAVAEPAATAPSNVTSIADVDQRRKEIRDFEAGRTPVPPETPEQYGRTSARLASETAKARAEYKAFLQQKYPERSEADIEAHLDRIAREQGPVSEGQAVDIDAIAAKHGGVVTPVAATTEAPAVTSARGAVEQSGVEEAPAPAAPVPPPSVEPQPVEVDSARLDHGTWNHTTQKQEGEGDIAAGYSGDTIPGGRVRSVVTVEGKSYVNTGGSAHGVTLWPLVPRAEWKGPTRSYGEATKVKTSADDPYGFNDRTPFTYEGIVVTHRGKSYVMGPRSESVNAVPTKKRGGRAPTPDATAVAAKHGGVESATQSEQPALPFTVGDRVTADEGTGRLHAIANENVKIALEPHGHLSNWIPAARVTKAEPGAAEGTTAAAPEPPSLASRVYQSLTAAAWPEAKNAGEFRRVVATRLGVPEKTLADDIDALSDGAEAALLDLFQPSDDLSESIVRARKVEALLPRAHRTLEKSKLQQFSTPLPIAVMAAKAAGVQAGDRVLEPTAGTGNLLAPLKDRTDLTISAVELSPRRVELLRAQGYDVKRGDYLHVNLADERPSVIISNPPWGKYTTGKYGKGIALGFAPSDVAERFVAKMLRDLADGGRLVAVMPTTMLSSKSFKDWLKGGYSVRAVIKSPPGSYDTRATSVESVLLVVDKVPSEGTFPKVVAADSWEAYAQAVEAIHERGPISAEARRPAAAPRPAPERGPERVPGSARPAGPESGRHAPVGAGRPADVVASEPAVGGRTAVEPERAPARAPAPPDGAPAAHVSAPSADTRRDAAASRFFAPYIRRTAIRGQPHPKLLVEAKQLAGVPYPAITVTPTPTMQAAIDAGRVSVEQAEQALAVLQANSGEKPHGYLAADAVGVGKSREIAMSLLGAMDRAKAEGRALRLMLTTKSRDNVEDLLEEIHFVASGKPSTQGGGVPFEVYRIADDYPGAKKTGNDYEPLPKGQHAVYVVDSYNVAPYRQALVDVDLHGIVGDEVQRFMNQEAAIGGSWLNLHARIFKDTPRAQQFFAYFTATPAQKVEDYRYLYGLRLWPVDGFAEWLQLVTGALDEKKARELEDATERGSVKSLDDIVKDTTVDVVGGDADEGGAAAPAKKKGKSWDSYASNVFAQRLTPAEGEQIPREWKMLGRFSARDLWRAGTTFEIHEFKLTPAQLKHYDQFVDLARDIYETAYKYGLYDKTGKSSRFGVTGMLQFAAKRIQMQPSLEEAVRLAKQLAGEGYQPVLSIINVSEMTADRGHLVAAIEKINTRMVDEDPDDPEAGPTDLGEIPEAVIDRARLMDRVRDLGALPDPVDYIAESLGREKVAFIIGKEKAGRRKASAEFQSGQRTYAVISGAGSTGINLDQRIKTKTGPGHGRRVFLDVQYEWSAMEGVQRYGRVDRASSIAPPRLIALTSGNAAEKKFLATIANRMAALGALSKGGAEATGAAGNALEEFEILGDDALAAARRAYEESDDATKRSFATIKSAFRDPNRNGKSPDREDFDPFKPARDAHGVGMLDFQLPLLLMPVQEANAFWEKFIRYRDELRAASGEQQAMRSARFSGEVLQQTVLKTKFRSDAKFGDQPDTQLTLYSVKNDQGKKFGILVGLITPEMPRLRELLRGANHAEGEEGDFTNTADVSFRRRYVTFTSGDDIITGLQVPWTRIPTIAQHYGKTAEREALDTPARVLAYLKAGETITLGVVNPDSGKPWVLRYRKSDGRVAIDNARMADRTQLLQHGADYAPVGNYWFTTAEKLGHFLERWPVPEQAAPTKRGGEHAMRAVTAEDEPSEHEMRAPQSLQTAVTELRAAHASLKATLTAPTVSHPARLSSRYLKFRIAQMVHTIDYARRALAPYRNAVEKATVDHEQILDWADRLEGVEGAKPLPAFLQPWLAIRKEVFDYLKKQIAELGIEKQWRDYYLGHVWETQFKEGTPQPGVIGRLIGRRPLQGPKSFLKQRTIPTMRQGVDRGLVPKTWNLVDIDLYKMQEMAKFVLGRQALEDNKRLGTWVFQTALKKGPKGMVAIPDPIGEVWAPSEITVAEAYDQLLTEGLENFVRGLGVTYARKPMQGEKWGGSNVKTGAITMRFGAPEFALMHEIGHTLDTLFGLYKRIATKLKTPEFEGDPSHLKEFAELAKLRYQGQQPSADYKRYVQKHAEQIANLVHGYLYAPELTRRVAPNAYDALDELVLTEESLAPLGDLQQMRSLVLGTRSTTQRLPGPILLGRYYAPPEVARIFKNYLTPGLSADKLWQLVRIPANALVQAKLSFGGFHAFTITQESAAMEAARGITDVLRGRPSGVARIGKALAEPVNVIRRGLAVRREYRSTLDPLLLAADSAVNLLLAGGGRVEQSREYSNRSLQKFLDSLRRANGAFVRQQRGRAGAEVLGAALHALPALVEAAAWPIMQWLVPVAKAGSTVSNIRQELAHLPGRPTEQTLLAVAGKAVNLSDATLGEVIWDNYFLPRALMSAVHMLIMAPGWRGGSAVLLARGLTDPVRRAFPSQRETYTVRVPVAGAGGGKGAGAPPTPPTSGGAPPPVQEKTLEVRERYWSPYTSVMIATVLVQVLISELYQWAHGAGHVQSIKDVAFPRTGEVDQNGKPERVRLPGYAGIFYDILRDVPSSILEYALGGTAPMPTAIGQLYHNETIFGEEIIDKSGGWRQQLADYARFLKDQFEPISVSSYGRRAGTPAEKAESAIGISPAPGRVTRTAAEEYLHSIAPPTHRTHEQAEQAAQRRTLIAARRTHDTEAAKGVIASGELSRRSIVLTAVAARKTSLQRSFGPTTLEQALHTYELATPEERGDLKALLAQKWHRLYPNEPPTKKADVAARFKAAIALPTATRTTPRAAAGGTR